MREFGIILRTVSVISVAAAFSVQGPVAISRCTSELVNKRQCAHRTLNNRLRLEMSTHDNDYEVMSDEELLQTVTLTQLEELCQQCGLTTDSGSKEELLRRLRAHAEEQATAEQQRRKDRISRVEQGTGTASRERYEIVGGDKMPYFTPTKDDPDDGDDEDDRFFFFPLPTTNDDNDKTSAAKSSGEDGFTSPKKTKTTTRPKPYVTQSDVLAGPPPPVEPDKNGERRVTVYNSADHNDLTGLAAAQPGNALQARLDPMVAGSQQTTPQPWDMDQQTTTKKATSKELEQSKETVTELVQTLLAMSGAPAFSHFDMPENLEDINNKVNQEGGNNDESASADGLHARTNGEAGLRPFVGFDPSKVPAHILEESSPGVRANRGQVLQDVLREFELYAIGQDGVQGDNVEKGGGHFREVAKVRAFLEGFRRAQVRKTARETVTMLLDKLVSEGIDGLDLSLSSMTRSSDDSDSTNDLNDSLINYLGDVIREQEKRVDHILVAKETGENPLVLVKHPQGSLQEDDPVERLWNRTMGDNGEQIQSIDPSDPKVQRVLREEAAKAETENLSSSIQEKTAPQNLLLLLTLLRERIKTEAAFVNDERGRNLRILAYCLRCPTEKTRAELILKEMGNSIDRLDSFLELVASSIEYAQSAVQQLQPAKRNRLNVKQLRSIHGQAERLREQQAWKASGLKPSGSESS